MAWGPQDLAIKRDPNGVVLMVFAMCSCVWIRTTSRGFRIQGSDVISSNGPGYVASEECGVDLAARLLQLRSEREIQKTHF